MSSKQPATVSMSLERFASHGGDDSASRDGWGIVYYADGDIRRFSDTGPAAESDRVKFVEKQPLCSTKMLAHMRGANVGSVCLPNTHPFSRELGGNVHTFAHNGYLESIAKIKSFDLQRFRPIGDTDSEWAFCALLDRLRKLWMRDTDIPAMQERFEIIRVFAGEIRDLGLPNFLYCDGKYRAPGLWSRDQRAREYDCECVSYR